MGIEYELRVPESAQLAVAQVLEAQLLPLVRELDPLAEDPFPNAFVKQVPQGVYVCDNLTDSGVANAIIRRLVDLLLRHAPQVTVVEP